MSSKRFQKTFKIDLIPRKINGIVELKIGGKMKLSDVVKTLNGAVQNFEQYKIHNHSDFHIKVTELFDNLQAQGKIPKEFEINLWHISYKNYHDKVISYNRDFVEYKNCNYGSKGNFSNVRFAIELVVDGTIKSKVDLQLEAIELYFEVERTTLSIQTYKKTIERLGGTLRESYEGLAVEQTKLLRLLVEQGKLE